MDNWRRFRIGGSSNGHSKETPTLNVTSDDKGKGRELGDEFLWGLENVSGDLSANCELQ
jgi:hypothetical protein